MFNKQSFIVLVNKFIGQIKSLFSRFTKKNPKELMQQSILVIISYKNTIKIFIDKYFERFKLQAKLQKIKVFVEQFKLQAKLQKVKIFAEQIKSWKFKEFVEQIKSFKVKSLLERFAKQKQIEVIPDGILGMKSQECSVDDACTIKKNNGSYKIDWDDQYSLNNWMTQLDLVCAQPYVIGLMGVISFVSFSIGSLLFTNIIDRAGRKYVVLVASLVTPIGIAVLLLVH